MAEEVVATATATATATAGAVVVVEEVVVVVEGAATRARRHGKPCNSMPASGMGLHLTTIPRAYPFRSPSPLWSRWAFSVMTRIHLLIL